MIKKNTYNTIVIGGGPTGLYFCKLLEEEKKDYLLIEGFKEVGGQCVQAYPNKYMYDIPGTGPISGKEYINLLMREVNKKRIKVNEKYLEHIKEKDEWVLKTDKEEYRCTNLVFSTGVGLGTYSRPKVENLKLYENKQIFFFPSNPDLYKNKKVVVFGGGDSALDSLEILGNLNCEITLVHRRDRFSWMSGKEKYLEDLFKKITIYKFFNLKSLNSHGEGGILSSVTIENPKENLTKILEVDYVFFCYGYDKESMNVFLVDINKMTHESGVIAIGAANKYKEKRDLITTGIWECRVGFEYLKD